MKVRYMIVFICSAVKVQEFVSKSREVITQVTAAHAG